MRASCRSNALQLAARFGARARAVGPELRKAADEIARELTKESTATLQREVYDVPVPLNRRGKPKWVRTRTLIGNEKFRRRGVDVYRDNPTPYSINRYRLGTPRGRPIRSPGIRVSHWYTTAILRRGSWIRRTREAAIRRALRLGR